MNHFLRLYWLLLVALIGGGSIAVAQTITTGAVAPTSVCAGTQIDVNFTTTGTVGTNSAFQVQLSDGSAYSDLSTTGNSSPLKATIPTSAPAGTSYKVRVVAYNTSTKAVTAVGTASSAFTVKAKPAQVGIPSDYTDCQRVSGSTLYDLNLSVKLQQQDATVRVYNEAGNTVESSTSNPPATDRSVTIINGRVAAGIKNYYFTQTVNGCESDKSGPLKVTIKPSPDAAPSPTNPQTTGKYNQYGSVGRISYCQDEVAKPLNVNGHAPVNAGTTVIYSVYSGNSGTGNPPTPNTSTLGTTVYRLRSDINGCSNFRETDSFIEVTVSPAPQAPAVGVTFVSYCQNAIPSSLAATGDNLRWYNAPTGGNQVSNTPSTKIAGKTTYYVSQTVGGCESPRSSVTVDVREVPPAPTATASSVNYCIGSTASALSAIAASGGTLKWYDPSGTALAGPPTPPTDKIATLVYTVSQTVGNSCESGKTTITVSVNAIPESPTVSNATVSYCQGATAVPLTATGQNLKWYTVASGGTGVSSVTPDTKTIGSKTYYVTQTVSTCESAPTTITVTINSLPSAPSVSPTPYSFCSGQSGATISATLSATNNNYLWSGSPALTNQAINGTTASATVPTDQADTYAYSITQTDANGCTSPKATITVTVKQTPGAPKASTIFACQSGPAPALTVAGATGASFKWYNASSGGNALDATPTPVTSKIGDQTFYVSQTVNGCEGTRAALTVTVRALPPAPSVSQPTVAYCNNATASPLIAAGTSLQWYDVSSGGSVISNTPSTGTVGTKAYYVSQTVNGCEGPRDTVTVTIKPNPKNPTVASSSLAFCQNTTAPTLNATADTSATLLWTFNGKQSSTAPAIPNNQATTYAVTVSQTVNGCTSGTTAITVTVNPTPGAPSVPANPPSVCQNTSSVTLSATGSNLKWYTTASSTDSSTTAPVQETSKAGDFTYYVSQSQKGCEGPRAAAKVTIKPLPNAPGVENKTVCQDSPVQTLSADGKSIKWFDASDNVLSSAPQPATQVDQEQTYTYKTTQTVDGCESSKATLTFKVQVTAKPTVTSPVTYCQNATAKPLEATGQDLTWFDPYGNWTKTAPTPPTLNVSTTPQGDAYQVVQTVNGCPSRKAEIRLIVNSRPTAQIPSTSATVNLGMPVKVTLTFTSVPPFSYTLSDGTKDSTADMQKEITLLPTKTTVYTITSISNSCGTGTPVGSFTVNVNVPTVTTSALTSATACAGSSIQVPFTTNGAFNNGNLFKVEVATDTSFSTIVYTSGTVAQSPVPVSLPATLAQGTYRVRVTASNPQIPVPGSASPTALNVRAIPTAVLSGSKDIYDGDTTPLTFTFTGDAPWTIEYSDSSSTKKETANSTPYTVSVTPLRTTTYRAVSVANGCGVGQASGTAVIRVLPVLGLEPDPLLTAVKVFPTPTDGLVTIDIDLPLQKEAAHLQLTDQNGRLIKRTVTKQRATTLDLSQQPGSIYYLQIQIGNRSTVRKIMKR